MLVARTALASRHHKVCHRQQQLIWPVAPVASPVDLVWAVILIAIDIRLFTNPWGQFPQRYKRASGGPLVAKGLSNPMNSQKHTSICTAVGKQSVSLTQDYTIQVFELYTF